MTAPISGKRYIKEFSLGSISAFYLSIISAVQADGWKILCKLSHFVGRLKPIPGIAAK